MSEDKIRQWLQNRYENMDADPSEIEDWILENGDSPDFDVMMMELLEPFLWKLWKNAVKPLM